MAHYLRVPQGRARKITMKLFLTDTWAEKRRIPDPPSQAHLINDLKSTREREKIKAMDTGKIAD
jgi:hypothetical protein